MPAYLLQTAFVFAGSALVSLFAFTIRSLSAAGERKIQLPTGDDVFPNEGFAGPLHVLEPLDLIDGEIVDEPKFRTQVRRKKILLVMLLAIALAIQTVLFLRGLSPSGSGKDTYSSAASCIYTFYLILLSLRLLWRCPLSTHAVLVVHLSVLASIAAIGFAINALLPPSATTATLWQHDISSLRLWYTTVCIYFVAALVASTIQRGPSLHLPLERIYSQKTASTRTNPAVTNVTALSTCSVLDFIFFNYATPAVRLGRELETLAIADFPVVPAASRAAACFARIRRVPDLRLGMWTPKPGSGFQLGYRLARANWRALAGEVSVSIVVSVMYYAPKWCLKLLVEHLESGEERADRWAWVIVIGMFASNLVTPLLFNQVIYLAMMTLFVRIRTQLNTMLFAKTLIRKDVASSSGGSDADKKDKDDDTSKKDTPSNDDNFSSKAQIMTLITTDVDRVADLAMDLFAIINCPIEISVATLILYNILGVSCFVGLVVAVFTVPMNHFAGKMIAHAQEMLLKSRDKRVALMNEVLGAIRMLKFMAWERSFEERVMKIRERELHWQKITFMIQVTLNAIWDCAPVMITLVSFYHFAVVRGQPLTPSVAFTAIAVFAELRFALNNLPQTMIKLLQGFVSLRRMEVYLQGTEITHSDGLPSPVVFRSATVAWPQDVNKAGSQASSTASTPRRRFMLTDLSVEFPKGELSLVCGRLGAGKTLVLLALLGEADVLAGQVMCPRSRPDAIGSFVNAAVGEEEWVVDGVTAYVPQTAWLRNASIKDNILFDLPYVEERYRKTVEACALLDDFKILEDGDESEIGEQGIGLSGGQKARVSLARAVYSRASTVLLDDVLSAVDAHTAHYLYNQCLKGELMRGRTIVLVSHHVQLCATGARYVVVLDNGQTQFSGDGDTFRASSLIHTLMQSSAENVEDDEVLAVDHGDRAAARTDASSETAVATNVIGKDKDEVEKVKAPRKLVEDEAKAAGTVSQDIWVLFVKSCGGRAHWVIASIAVIMACLTPILENGWLKCNLVGLGIRAYEREEAMFYIGIYAAIRLIGLLIPTFRWWIFFAGSLKASQTLYKNLLETILFTPIRFHDTVSKGRLLNRFGKDFEVIDSQLVEHFGLSVFLVFDLAAILAVMLVVGGYMFLLPIIILGALYVKVSNDYRSTARTFADWVYSISRSPLYSIYGETISGVSVIRAFGASTKYMKDMLQCADTNTSPTFWQHCFGRWLDIRMGQLANVVNTLVAVVILISPRVDASMAGFSLSISSSTLWLMSWMVVSYVGLEQSMIALERVKEYTELPREAPEFSESRPPADWPSSGEVTCKDLVIRYAPELPAVLHGVSFTVKAGEKVGILGRTGSGKSTLAMSLFRFVEATEGSIAIDGLDVSKVGLTDLRSRLTIIPQDPTVLSGTVRSTLDVFDEHEDVEIFKALRRVHLIPGEDDDTETPESINVNVFRDLDSPVSEGGENLSTGERQLLCMARAILKRSKVLVMDEATASVDYATDELIGKTIRQAFSSSTVLTIAHRLRTVIDYDRIMVLEEGKIAEFGAPAELLADKSSHFFALCKATGREEFAMLKKMASSTA